MKGFIRPRRPHCDHGHPITGTGSHRKCRTCANARKRAQWAAMTPQQRAKRNARSRAWWHRTDAPKRKTVYRRLRRRAGLER